MSSERLPRFSTADIDFSEIRAEFELPADYPEEALAEARQAVDRYAAARDDRTHLPMVTIDPVGAKDLDQAIFLETARDGFVVHYAIADLGAVVTPGGALDAETRRRGQTVYLPDDSVPLHPRVLSEGSSSLLPDQVSPCVLWRIELDGKGEPTAVSVRRALVRSVARLDYRGVQADYEAGRLHPSIAALPVIGALRMAGAVARGAIELRMPEQDVVRVDGQWSIQLEPRTEFDDWNAEISLLTGMCAGQLMLDGGVGLLRTMPPAEKSALSNLRAVALALGVDWPEGEQAGRVLAALAGDDPRTLPMMMAATRLLRGADYTAFNGAPPELTEHAGIGAPYAHVTAPLRRLADRFAAEICLALSAGEPAPAWATEALAEVRGAMHSTGAVAGKVERACVDLTEATLLAPRVGQTFEAAVTRAADGKRPAEVFVLDPPTIAACEGNPPEGRQITVRLAAVDPTTRTVRFEYSAG
ncbi:RNB domain-containing ribonuclease [Tomitella biformata]|uniref:RNB domain-containing ribonuclease n=1 Tax=Tomitella biformata TaxID=630403 RepID=UPI000467BD8F|nr:RNB domain-containing ribonuclease [Tomitella biformata]